MSSELKTITRHERLARLKTYASMQSLFKKLTAFDVHYMNQFLKVNEDLDAGQLSRLVNRLFIDGQKPKNHTQIWAILSELCSEEIGERK